MVRSIPEKTLEHWVSFYINYRYRSHSGQWWPTEGEDIAVNGLPSRPGKILQFEVKTSELSGRHQDIHTVRIDRRQLCAYLRRPLGLQPYYLFCAPEWAGQFQVAARGVGADPYEFAFSRVGSSPLGGWFVRWSIVMSARDVNSVLGNQVCGRTPCVCLDAHDRLLRKSYRRSDDSWITQWQTNVDVTRWHLRGFLDHFDRCGGADTSQIIIAPAAGVAGPTVTRVDLMNALAAYRQANFAPRRVGEAANLQRSHHEAGEFSTYVGEGDGIYRLNNRLLSSEWIPQEEWVKSGRSTAEIVGVFVDVSQLDIG